MKTLKKLMSTPVTKLSTYSPDKLAGMGAVATFKNGGAAAVLRDFKVVPRCRPVRRGLNFENFGIDGGDTIFIVFIVSPQRPRAGFETGKTLSRDLQHAFLSFPSFDPCLRSGNATLKTLKTVGHS